MSSCKSEWNIQFIDAIGACNNTPLMLYFDAAYKTG